MKKIKLSSISRTNDINTLLFFGGYWERSTYSGSQFFVYSCYISFSDCVVSSRGICNHFKG